MKKMNKRGVMDQLGALAVGIATLTIVLVVAFLVVGNTQTQIESQATHGNWSQAYNATETLESAAASVPGWVPLIVIVAIGALIIGMVGMFQGRK